MAKFQQKSNNRIYLSGKELNTVCLKFRELQHEVNIGAYPRKSSYRSHYQLSQLINKIFFSTPMWAFASM